MTAAAKVAPINQAVRKRKPVKPAKAHSAHQAIMLRVTADGRFEPADDLSRRICKDRGMKVGSEFMGYLYEPRDAQQWRTAHTVAGFLASHVDAFFGMGFHAVLKKIQVDARIAMDVEKIDLGTLGVVTREVPRTLAFGAIDNTQWTAIWREMCGYIRRTYFGEIDADAVDEMDRLMLREETAA